MITLKYQQGIGGAMTFEDLIPMLAAGAVFIVTLIAYNFRKPKVKKE